MAETDIRLYAYRVHYTQQSGGQLSGRPMMKLVEGEDEAQATARFNEFAAPLPGISISRIERINLCDIRRAILRECEKRPNIELSSGAFIALLFGIFPEKVILQEIDWLEDVYALDKTLHGGVPHYMINQKGIAFLNTDVSVEEVEPDLVV